MSTDNIIYDGDTVIDLSEDTVTPESLLEGVTAHDATGTPIVGTNQGSSGSVLYAAEQALSDEQKSVARSNIGAKDENWMPTAEEVGARPSTWMPTAEEVGARPSTWMPTAEEVGARPSTWTPSASDVGARPDNWMPTASDVGARPSGWMPTASDVGARPSGWMPTASDVGARPSGWMPTADDVGAVSLSQQTTSDAQKMQVRTNLGLDGQLYEIVPFISGGATYSKDATVSTLVPFDADALYIGCLGTYNPTAISVSGAAGARWLRFGGASVPGSSYLHTYVSTAIILFADGATQGSLFYINRFTLNSAGSIKNDGVTSLDVGPVWMIRKI